MIKKNIIQILKVVGFIGIYVFFNFLVLLGSRILYTLYNQSIGKPYYETFYKMFLTEHLFELLLIISLLTLLTYFLIYKLSKNSLIKLCRFNPIKLKLIFPMFLLGASIIIINICLHKWIFNTRYYLDFSSIILMKLPKYLLIIGIIGPIFEEILFRGIIFNNLRKHMNIHLAVILQAIIFGVMHMNAFQSSHTTIGGIIMAYSYILTNSLLAPIIIHITINSTAGILELYASQHFFLSYGVYMFIIAIITVIAVLYYLFKTNRFTMIEFDKLEESENNEAPISEESIQI